MPRARTSQTLVGAVRQAEEFAAKSLVRAPELSSSSLPDGPRETVTSRGVSRARERPSADANAEARDDPRPDHRSGARHDLAFEVSQLGRPDRAVDDDHEHAVANRLEVRVGRDLG